MSASELELPDYVRRIVNGLIAGLTEFDLDYCKMGAGTQAQKSESVA